MAIVVTIPVAEHVALGAMGKEMWRAAMTKVHMRHPICAVTVCVQ